MQRMTMSDAIAFIVTAFFFAAMLTAVHYKMALETMRMTACLQPHV